MRVQVPARISDARANVLTAAVAEADVDVAHLDRPAIDAHPHLAIAGVPRTRMVSLSRPLTVV